MVISKIEIILRDQECVNLQILVKYQNQGQFQNLLLRFPKLSLEVKFDQDLAEKIKVKDNRLIPK